VPLYGAPSEKDGYCGDCASEIIALRDAANNGPLVIFWDAALALFVICLVSCIGLALTMGLFPQWFR
jgi:hypothetical protein